MDFKGVLIDFYYTLAYVNIEENTRHREEIVSVLTMHGYDGMPVEVSAALDSTSRSSKKGEVKDMREYYRLFIEKLGIAANQDLVGNFIELRSRYLASGFGLYDGAVQALSALKSKYRLALVSNCSVGLSDAIEALGLVPFFKTIILSYEVGSLKPERQIYAEALERLRFEPEECVFVSDEISDLEGAREVCLKTLLVRQGQYTHHNVKDPNFRPDFECNHVSEITKFL